MASLVTDVLAHTGLLQKEDLSTRIGKLTKQIDEIKVEVCNTVQDTCVDFRPNVDTMGRLHSQVQSLSGEVDGLCNKLEHEVNIQLSSSAADVQKMNQDMEKVDLTITVMQILFEIHEGFKSFDSCLCSKEYLRAADVLDKVDQNFNELVNSEFSQLRIVAALKTEICVKREELLYKLNETWRSSVVWESTSTSVYLKIVHDPQLTSMLHAMHKLRTLQNKLEVFAKKLVHDILEPSIKDPSASLRLERSELKSVLMIKHIRETDQTKKPEEVFILILNGLTFLSKLFHSCIFIGSDGEKISLMRQIGNLLWPDLTECVIKHCLVPSIPSSTKKLEDYQKVIEQTEQFETKLKAIDFISEDTSPLFQYAKNVNIHFANKKCQDIMLECRELMKKELYDTIEVGSVPEEQARKGEKRKKGSPKASEVKKETKAYLEEGTLRFPRCHISKTIQSLMDLIHETLQEASTSSPQCACQLLSTVRNVFEAFMDIVPIYHRKNLVDLPQAAALYHNNCMFLAHHLRTLGHQYRHSLPSYLADSPVTFVDLIPSLSTSGAQIFVTQMHKQRDELFESLAGARGFHNVSDPDVHPDAERAIRQVLYQLSRLKSVWGHILPSNIFTKAMSTLIGAVVQNLVEKITSLEDISKDDASLLYHLMQKLQEEIPAFIRPTDSEEPIVVEVHIKVWQTFKELMFILDAKMQDILERWADGKGPIAEVFHPTEVKSLIRALFQNTDKRAAVLSKIRFT